MSPSTGIPVAWIEAARRTRLFPNMVCKTTSSNSSRRSRRRSRGFSFVELLVATVIGGVALAAVAALLGYTARSFCSLANYSDLNRASMRALDYLTRDVRAASAVTTFTTNQIVFNMGTNNPSLTYSYSVTDRTLTRSQGTNSRVLLTDCD